MIYTFTIPEEDAKILLEAAESLEVDIGEIDRAADHDRADGQLVEVRLPIEVEAQSDGNYKMEIVYEACDCGCKLAFHRQIVDAGVHDVRCMHCDRVHVQG